MGGNGTVSDQAIDRTKLPIRRPPYQGVVMAQIDRTSAKELKAGLAEAQAGMGG